MARRIHGVHRRGFELMEIIDTLRSVEDVSVRLALRDPGGLGQERVLSALVVDALPEMPSYTWSVYQYDSLTFLNAKVSGKELQNWFNEAEESVGDLQGHKFKIPKLERSIWKDWFPSRTDSSYFSVCKWPHSVFRLSLANYEKDDWPSMLIGNDCPFFPDYDSAVLSLLFEQPYKYGSPPLFSPLHGIVCVRFAYAEAWIESIHFRPTSLSISVVGDNVEGTQLQIFFPPSVRIYKQLSQCGELVFPLQHGMPDDLWIVLSRGMSLLDYRFFKQNDYQRNQHDNIYVEYPEPDFQSKVEGLISRGEGFQIEFKRDIPERHERLLKHVAAFANGDGGTILLGVDDDGTVVGFGGDIDRTSAAITNMVRNNLVPEPEYSIDTCLIDKRTILIINVKKGNIPPYGLDRDRPVFYVRRGATTFLARQEEIRALGQASTSPIEALPCY